MNRVVDDHRISSASVLDVASGLGFAWPNSGVSANSRNFRPTESPKEKPRKIHRDLTRQIGTPQRCLHSAAINSLSQKTPILERHK